MQPRVMFNVAHDLKERHSWKVPSKTKLRTLVPASHGLMLGLEKAEVTSEAGMAALICGSARHTGESNRQQQCQIL